MMSLYFKLASDFYSEIIKKNQRICGEVAGKTVVVFLTHKGPQGNR